MRKTFLRCCLGLLVEYPPLTVSKMQYFSSSGCTFLLVYKSRRLCPVAAHSDPTLSCAQVYIDRFTYQSCWDLWERFACTVWQRLSCLCLEELPCVVCSSVVSQLFTYLLL